MHVMRIKLGIKFYNLEYRILTSHICHIQILKIRILILEHFLEF